MPVKGGHRHVDQARISSGHARINSSFPGPGFFWDIKPSCSCNAGAMYELVEDCEESDAG